MKRTAMSDSPEYASHRLFATIDRYTKVYECLSMSVQPFLTMGTGAFINIDSYLFESIGGTLHSVRAIVGEGRINDGYALLRKYFDSITLSVYIDLYLNDQRDKGLAVEQVNNWLRRGKPLPEYPKMRGYVARSHRLDPVIGMLLKADGRYKAIRDRCNGHMHHLDFESVLLNDKYVHVERIPLLDQIEDDVTDLFVLHLTCIFFINEHYMMSSDYLDCRECGLDPPADAQYWVAPFVQDVFDDVLAVRRPDVCCALKRHTSMHLA